MGNNVWDVVDNIWYKIESVGKTCATNGDLEALDDRLKKAKEYVDRAASLSSFVADKPGLGGLLVR